MKKVSILCLICLSFLMMSCTGQSIEDRSFTYYDSRYGKFYLEVDALLIDDHEDIITLTIKFTASQALTFILDTMDDGKAGVMKAEIRQNDHLLYSSDDLPPISLGGEVTLDINEKVFRFIQFSLTPFSESSDELIYPEGDYVIWLYMDQTFLIETDMIITINF